MYATLNGRFGFLATDSTFKPPRSGKSPLIFSADPDRSDIPPHTVVVATVAEMRAYLGPVDRFQEVDCVYPSPYRKEYNDIIQQTKDSADTWPGLDSTTKDNILLAARAYVYGDSKQVESYVPLVNALLFPVTLAYFATSEDMTIDQEWRIEGDDPVVSNFNHLTLSPGGSIVATVDFTLSCTSLTKVS
jgi:hypothetical protein